MHLFRPLTVGSVRLPNRIAMTALVSGCASADGFVHDALCAYYAERAAGGVGLIVLEAAYAIAPDSPQPHVGMYADVLVPAFRKCVTTLHHHGASVLAMLDQPLAIDAASGVTHASIADAWVAAAVRVHAAGADGIMLSCADGGPFDQLLAQSFQRVTAHNSSARIQVLLEVIDRIHMQLGKRLVIGVRLSVGESTNGGLSLQDARVIAKRLAGAGVRLLEISCEAGPDTPVARFPGWCVPLAAAIKAIVDVPVMVGGLLADPELADSVIADGSVDLVALGESLRAEPRWPLYAQAVLQERDNTDLSDEQSTRY